jgi:hypothetical protein
MPFSGTVIGLEDGTIIITPINCEATSRISVLKELQPKSLVINEKQVYDNAGVDSHRKQSNDKVRQVLHNNG